ncbi:MAG: hypothetical protein ACE5G8_15000, partial [Anaerolineae bacterium]
WLWLLPPVMALWVNFHGAYALGFLLAGGALVGGGGNRRALLVALGGMAAASLLNPRGWGAWQYVFTLLTDPASQQLGAEWQPPTTEVWQGTLLFGWLLLFPVLLSTCSRRPGAADWVWFLGFGWLALTGLRYVIWFVAVLAPITARVLAPRLGAWLDRAAVRGIPALNGAIFLLLLALPLALLPGLRSRWWRAAPPVLSPNTPVEATAWLARHPELPGPLWSDLAFSSYLIYALPRRPVWIDTRFELYPLEQWQQYVEIAGAGPEWPALLQGEGIGLAMIDPAVQSRLRLALERSPEWCGVYRDGRALIFARRAAQTPCLPSATVPPP